MTEKFSDKIKKYCETNGITIPSGFYRHPASRYVVIKLIDPPKLVASTWFKKEDLLYYLNHLEETNNIQILDFKEDLELQYSSDNKLKKGTALSLTT